MASNIKLKELSDQLSDNTVEDRLKKLASLFPDKIVFTTSFGIEDQVISHMIFTNNLNIKVVTLDTGRLFPETYEVFSKTILKYNKEINVFFPDYKDIEAMVSEKGPLSFFESKENRLECCRLRKVVPLARALAGQECWITGIRAEQSPGRSNMVDLEYEEEKKIIKYHPLFNWTLSEVENYIKDNNVPYNTLYDKGYVSIGCEPCTRPIFKGQDFRDGRWWWENDGPKECGFHVKF